MGDKCRNEYYDKHCHISNSVFFAHHRNPVHVPSHDQVLLSPQHKERVLCKSSNMSLSHELQYSPKCFRVSVFHFCDGSTSSPCPFLHERKHHGKETLSNSGDYRWVRLIYLGAQFGLWPCEIPYVK